MTLSRERGILLKGPLVRAVLDGRKTETRRPVTPSRVRTVSAHTLRRVKRPEGLADALARGLPMQLQHGPAIAMAGLGPIVAVPHVRGGDRLWVRETWAPCDTLVSGYTREDPCCVRYAADGAAHQITGDPVEHRALDTTGWRDGGDGGRWRSALLMPRWASRLVPVVVEVHIERLSGLDENGALQEGVGMVLYDHLREAGDHDLADRMELAQVKQGRVDAFLHAWGSMYGGTRYAAEHDPLVLVYRWHGSPSALGPISRTVDPHSPP